MQCRYAYVVYIDAFPPSNNMTSWQIRSKENILWNAMSFFYHQSAVIHYLVSNTLLSLILKQSAYNIRYFSVSELVCWYIIKSLVEIKESLSKSRLKLSCTSILCQCSETLITWWIIPWEKNSTTIRSIEPVSGITFNVLKDWKANNFKVSRINKTKRKS